MIMQKKIIKMKIISMGVVKEEELRKVEMG
jgi:hypothetical protein